MKRPLLVCLAFGAGMAGAAQARDFIVEDHLLAASDAPMTSLLGDRDGGRPYGGGSHGGVVQGTGYRGEDGSASEAGAARGAARMPTTPDAAPPQPVRDTARNGGTPSAAPAAPRKPRNGEPSWQSLLPGSIQ
ncbi:hypothetical protein MBSD_n1534 [Mizugakiibacter sediminis]|uniref:Uncharacterized protein n=2 Tax=Mizugakiibacter sediminis TaxID=1475481 RepID=A0A0K8QNF8_9GAMM|nr:hypothetical protein MBSD_n1534 [Mizugakiibacter sediminis]